MSENSIGVIILLGIIVIALTGGFKASQRATQPTQQVTISQIPGTTIQEKQDNLQQQIENTKNQLTVLEAEKNNSPYKGIVTLVYVNRGTNANEEYLTIRVSGNSTTTIPITGWRIASTASGASVNIPKAAQLYFANSVNQEDPIVLKNTDVLYLITGTSPLGVSFRLNKCSGYLSQFQNFVPYLSTNCPLPRDENLSSIPKGGINDACFDYIDSFGGCRIQTTSLPVNWSTECVNFIYNKINYGSCVNTHKNDADFYQPDLRVYLKRSEPLWKSRREEIVLYDANGKIVSTLKY